MRGGPEETKQFFSYVDIEDRIAGDHPLRAKGQIVWLHGRAEQYSVLIGTLVRYFF